MLKKLMDNITEIFLILLITLFLVGCFTTTTTPRTAIAASNDPCEAAVDPVQIFMDEGESPWSITHMKGHGPFMFLFMVHDDPRVTVNRLLVCCDDQFTIVVSYAYVCRGGVYLYKLNKDMETYSRTDEELDDETREEFLKVLSDPAKKGV